MNLKWMQQRIKYYFSSIVGVGNNNNSTNWVAWLMPHLKEFCFSGCDVYNVMNCLDNWTIMHMYVSYWGSNLILNTCFWYNNYRF